MIYKTPAWSFSATVVLRNHLVRCLKQLEGMHRPMSCSVCGGSSNPFGETSVLKKYNVSYFRCERCGFIQTEKPYWLDEAYSEAIARQDVGVMSRNEQNVTVTASLLSTLFPHVDKCLDFGAGHGIFVRMMRDRGFNFFWQDLHASNDYARGFEYSESERYDFLTAFEVLEHFIDPIAELERLMTKADNVFVSTLTVPEPPPKLPDWWYYVPSTGQHISFYTRKSLEHIASRFGRHLSSTGTHHLFSTQRCSPLRFRLAMNKRCAEAINRLTRRTSLIAADFERLSGRPLR